MHDTKRPDKGSHAFNNPSRFFWVESVTSITRLLILLLSCLYSLYQGKTCEEAVYIYRRMSLRVKLRILSSTIISFIWISFVYILHVLTILIHTAMVSPIPFTSITSLLYSFGLWKQTVFCMVSDSPVIKLGKYDIQGSGHCYFCFGSWSPSGRISKHNFGGESFVYCMAVGLGTKLLVTLPVPLIAFACIWVVQWLWLDLHRCFSACRNSTIALWI